jgi:soluble lytic murein transglycosylase
MLAVAGVWALLWDGAGRRRAENRRLIADAARRLELPPALLLAVAETESGFDDRAVSKRGAQGLLQVMPQTGREVAVRTGFSRDPAARSDHALVGGSYLRSLLERYRGDLHLALAAYQAGPTRVDEWVARGRGLPGPETIEMFAFKETRRYVADVLAARGRFEAEPGAGRP